MKEKEINIEEEIFLLSEEEYENYKDKIPKINFPWWLRSSSKNSKCAKWVYDTPFSNIIEDIGIHFKGMVRPALKGTFDSYYGYINGKKIVYTIYCGITWIEIDRDLYIAELPIGYKQFDKKSKNYETSEIRKFLLDWYKERELLEYPEW